MLVLKLVFELNLEGVVVVVGVGAGVGVCSRVVVVTGRVKED